MKFFVTYVLLLAGAAAPAFKCFSVSMSEPFTTVTRHELMWQLIVPSSLLTLAAVGVCALVIGLAHRLVCAWQAAALGLATVLIGIVAGESIVGYLWDLRVHAAIQ